MFRRCLAIFILAFAVRSSAIVCFKDYKRPLRVELHRIATAVVSGEGFSNPYRLKTGATAHYTLGQPLLLAGIYRLFGLGRAGELAENVMGALSASLMYALLPVVSLQVGLGLAAGVIGGVIGALLPIHYLQEIRFNTGLDALLVMAVVVVSLARWRRAGPVPLSVSVLTGLLWGGVLLFNASAGSILAAFLAVEIFLLWKRQRPVLRETVAVVAVTFIVLLPWAYRNSVSLGSWIFTRSNFGYQMRCAFNPLAAPTINENRDNGTWARYNLLFNMPENERMLRLGEVQYNKQDLRDALEWIGQNPGRAASLIAHRFVWFWLPRTGRVAQSGLLWLLTGLSFAGWLLFLKVDRLGATAIGVIWAVFPLVYYVIEVETRYRSPIYWTYLITAGYAFGNAWQMIGRKTGWLVPSPQPDVCR